MKFNPFQKVFQNLKFHHRIQSNTKFSKNFTPDFRSSLQKFCRLNFPSKSFLFFCWNEFFLLIYFFNKRDQNLTAKKKKKKGVERAGTWREGQVQRAGVLLIGKQKVRRGETGQVRTNVGFWKTGHYIDHVGILHSTVNAFPYWMVPNPHQRFYFFLVESHPHKWGIYFRRLLLHLLETSVFVWIIFFFFLGFLFGNMVFLNFSFLYILYFICVE